MASAADNRRGILAMLAAMAFFVGNDALMKLAREVFPAGQAIVLRTVFAVATGLALVVAFGEAAKLRLALRPILLLRGAVESAVAISYIWALGLLPLANITAILMTSPIIIVVMAVLLRIERIGWRRGLAVLVGFIGVVIVVRPTVDGFSAAAAVALLSAALVGWRDLMTRSIAAEVPSTVISLTTTVIVGFVALAFGTTEAWVSPWRVQTVHLALAAVLVASGSLCIVSAFRHTDIGVVSGYRYAVVVFAVIIGYLVWGDVPDPVALSGIALIVGSGVYTMHRQQVRTDSKLRLPSVPPT